MYVYELSDQPNINFDYDSHVELRNYFKIVYSWSREFLCIEISAYRGLICKRLNRSVHHPPFFGKKKERFENGGPFSFKLSLPHF